MKKIPDKIPYMTGKMLPNGTYATSVKMIDKSHPKYKVALEEYLLWHNAPGLKGLDETPTDRKVKKS